MENTKTTERFWSHVNLDGKTMLHVDGIDNCWAWKASSRNKGYGAFCYPKGGDIIQGRAHRFSWELHFGEIPDGMCILHSCDNPPCCNPAHLSIGTRDENNKQAQEKIKELEQKLQELKESIK